MPRDERPKGAMPFSAWGNAPGTGIHHDQSPEGATQARRADAYMENTVRGMVRPYRAACGVGFYYPGRCPGLILCRAVGATFTASVWRSDGAVAVTTGRLSWHHSSLAPTVLCRELCRKLRRSLPFPAIVPTKLATKLALRLKFPCNAATARLPSLQAA